MYFQDFWNVHSRPYLNGAPVAMLIDRRVDQSSALHYELRLSSRYKPTCKGGWVGCNSHGNNLDFGDDFLSILTYGP